MDSSSDEKVMELEWPINKLKLSISHAKDCWHFKSKDQNLVFRNQLSRDQLSRDQLSRDQLSRNQLSRDLFSRDQQIFLRSTHTFLSQINKVSDKVY